MKTIAAFFVVNAGFVALQGIAAVISYGLGQLVIVSGLSENWLAWATAGILATGGAISVAARLARGIM